jgi:hypothetical protein
MDVFSLICHWNECELWVNDREAFLVTLGTKKNKRQTVRESFDLLGVESSELGIWGNAGLVGEKKRVEWTEFERF